MEGCILLFKHLKPVVGINSRLGRLPPQRLCGPTNSGKICSRSTCFSTRQNLPLLVSKQHFSSPSALFSLIRQHQGRLFSCRGFKSWGPQGLQPTSHVWRGSTSPLLCIRRVQGRQGLGYVVRFASGKGLSEEARRKRSMLIYICAVGIFMLGMSYAGVPLYRMFCQATGLGGQAVKGHDTEKVETMQKVDDRVIRVRFNADIAASMRWNFRPQQTEVKVLPGETALAFYTAKNPTNSPIVGISTYNVVPFEAGQYFNKIQCFCFEEQRLNPHEQVDMPVFFYIDPEFASDPKLQHVETITLSYTFFEAKEGLQLPLPSYATT